MDFYDWLNKKRVFNEIFGGFSYKLPNDRRQQMYDFYMLNYLQGRSSFDLRRNQEYQKSGIDTYQMGGARNPNPEDMDTEDKVDYMLGEVSKDMLPQLQKQLLEEVFFAISAEIRHVFDVNDGKKIYDNILKDLGEEYASYFKKYIKNRAILTNKDSDFTFRDKNQNDIEGANSQYEISYTLIKNSMPDDVFIKIAKYLFNNAGWNGGYGGKAWSNIVNGWLKLREAKGENSLKIWIDHVYDLQHNTDTVFNKLRDYRLDHDYTWIKSLLDHKAQSKSPLELIDGVSSQFKKLALRAIKLKHGETLEDIHRRKKDKNRTTGKEKASALTPKSSESFDFFYSSFLLDFNLDKKDILNFARGIKAYKKVPKPDPKHSYDEYIHYFKELNSGVSVDYSLFANYIELDNELEKEFRSLYNPSSNKVSLSDVSRIFNPIVVSHIKDILQYDYVEKTLSYYLGWNPQSIENLVIYLRQEEQKKLNKNNPQKEKSFANQYGEFKEFFKGFNEKHDMSNFNYTFMRAARVYYKQTIKESDLVSNYKSLFDNGNFPHEENINVIQKILQNDLELESIYGNLDDFNIIEKPLLSKNVLKELKEAITIDKIKAIKILREYLGWGLKSLKTFVEKMHYDMHKHGECNCSNFYQDTVIKAKVDNIYHNFIMTGLNDPLIILAKTSTYSGLSPEVLVNLLNVNKDNINLNTIEHHQITDKNLKDRIKSKNLSDIDKKAISYYYPNIVSTINWILNQENPYAYLVNHQYMTPQLKKTIEMEGLTPQDVDNIINFFKG